MLWFFFTAIHLQIDATCIFISSVCNLCSVIAMRMQNYGIIINIIMTDTLYH